MAPIKSQLNRKNRQAASAGSVALHGDPDMRPFPGAMG